MPRSTGGWCSRLSSPWRGRSPAGWQLTQRGWVSTLPSSVNMAADRASVSAIEVKLSGEARVFEMACEAASPGVMLTATGATEAKILNRMYDFIVILSFWGWLHLKHGTTHK